MTEPDPTSPQGGGVTRHDGVVHIFFDDDGALLAVEGYDEQRESDARCGQVDLDQHTELSTTLEILKRDSDGDYLVRVGGVTGPTMFVSAEHLRAAGVEL